MPRYRTPSPANRDNSHAGRGVIALTLVGALGLGFVAPRLVHDDNQYGPDAKVRNAAALYQGLRKTAETADERRDAVRYAAKVGVLGLVRDGLELNQPTLPRVERKGKLLGYEIGPGSYAFTIPEHIPEEERAKIRSLGAPWTPEEIDSWRKGYAEQGLGFDPDSFVKPHSAVLTDEQGDETHYVPLDQWENFQHLGLLLGKAYKQAVPGYAQDAAQADRAAGAAEVTAAQLAGTRGYLLDPITGQLVG